MSFTNTKQFPIKTIEQSVRCFKICADVRLYRRAVTHGEDCQCALPSQFSIRLAHVSFFLSFFLSYFPVIRARCCVQSVKLSAFGCFVSLK